MKRRYKLDIPPHLSRQETEVVIDVLEDVLDLLSRHLHELDRHTRPDDHQWQNPTWIEPLTGDDER